jgi:HD-GYP domain-containing protein (c-di-GMP phosphodiesterase class II)
MTTIDALPGPPASANGSPVIRLDEPVSTMASIRLLLETIRLRDPSLADHGLRTAHVAASLALELGASEDETQRAYLGALLHDVGKLGIAEAILWKPGSLDPSEWTQIRTHPEMGHRLVAGLVHEHVAACVLYHHERFDSGGYPFGVDLGTLPTEVRIVQVADAYDALTSDRPYESPVGARSAVAEITRCAGSQFDPLVVGALHPIFETTIDDGVIVVGADVDGVPSDPFA